MLRTATSSRTATGALTGMLATLALAAGAVTVAAPAHAITNPADNPRPITVKGDDGRTYTDGEDTLPGYDDVECSYIPGAWYDFANNRVHYADGQSVSWSEWERIPGYKSWKAKQGSAAKPAATAAPQQASPQGSGEKSKAKKQAATKQGSTKQATAQQSAVQQPGGKKTTPAAGQESEVTEPSDGVAGSDASSTPAPQSTDGASTDEATSPNTPADGVAGESSASDDTEVVDARLVAGQAEGSDQRAAAEQGSSAAGLLILGVLAAGAAALLGGWSLVGRRRKGVQS